MTAIRFRVLDTKNKKVLRDSSHYHAYVDRRDGTGTVVFNEEWLRPLLWTGQQTIYRQDIFEDDIIEFEWQGAMLVDSVHLTPDGWGVGASQLPLHELRVHRVVGSAWDQPWPVERMALKEIHTEGENHDPS